MSLIFELQSSFGALHWLHILFNQISNEANCDHFKFIF